ncbi:NAD-dependent epimerase/dehydratase family protein [Pullulanibacillus sp. KACC 23026]|uniref:NAD-dependent epimerase/dehydratase family protein n=1 Tax=Pullulanibacillus sp. KACC 23026 TaxID=3028315 RepID=UPI0023B00D77|nr:NAD-dependent epimerase/dehydratase family protein [Pullulanibacillus sp. KACC 23026]WEG11301.1 NAD-dependent epimerase/dehydratase family protein [Pullulanibacillus sp. KACC 23026]
MTKVLVLGGTRFFGKKLVEKFIQEGADVTILTRGKTDDDFGDAVSRLKADRTDSEALKKALGDASFDLVYDNICFGPQEAAAIIELLRGRVKKYIVTSSMSVYEVGGAPKDEGSFNPYSYPVSNPYPTDYDYGEGKRLVEAVTFQKGLIPSVAVRFPIVLGHDDYTHRLHFHIEHVQKGIPIGLPNPAAEMSFILSDEAATFLYWLGQTDIEGPYNASSTGAFTLSHILDLVEKAAGKPAVIEAKTEEAANMSPFGVPDSWYMAVTKATKAGFTFSVLESWLPQLINEIAAGTKE